MWVLIAVSAALAQTARNALARSLSPHISPALNSWSRFAFNLPFALALVGIVWSRMGELSVSSAYFGLCAIAAITQLTGNVFLVAAFSGTTFAQAIVFFKLEVLFTAIVGASVFGEMPSGYGWIGVGLCVVGVVWMNGVQHAVGSAAEARPVAGLRSISRALHFNRGSLLALASGLWLVVASFALKGANSELVLLNPRVGEDRFEVAVHTLFHVTWIEVLLLTLWLVWKEREVFQAVPIYWKRMGAIGFASFLGSLGWFWTFSLTLVAYVKAVGQIEALFAVVLAVLVWGERRALRQIPGVVVILAGIGLVLLG